MFSIRRELVLLQLLMNKHMIVYKNRIMKISLSGISYCLREQHLISLFVGPILLCLMIAQKLNSYANNLYPFPLFVICLFYVSIFACHKDVYLIQYIPKSLPVSFVYLYLCSCIFIWCVFVCDNVC